MTLAFSETGEWVRELLCLIYLFILLQFDYIWLTASKEKLIIRGQKTY